MNFELACLEDFNEIENLYWDLIDKSKEEPSFPDWEKGVHPSADFLMAGIVKKELFVLRDVRYEYRGMGLATQFVKNLISYAKLENIEAIHLDVIDKNTMQILMLDS